MVDFCCVHAGPYALTLYVPWYGSLASGRLNLRLPTLQIREYSVRFLKNQTRGYSR